MISSEQYSDIYGGPRMHQEQLGLRRVRKFLWKREETTGLLNAIRHAGVSSPEHLLMDRRVLQQHPFAQHVRLHKFGTIWPAELTEQNHRLPRAEVFGGIAGTNDSSTRR